jgi:hypothetical protein
VSEWTIREAVQTDEERTAALLEIGNVGAADPNASLFACIHAGELGQLGIDGNDGRVSPSSWPAFLPITRRMTTSKSASTIGAATIVTSTTDQK